MHSEATTWSQRLSLTFISVSLLVKLAILIPWFAGKRSMADGLADHLLGPWFPPMDLAITLWAAYVGTRKEGPTGAALAMQVLVVVNGFVLGAFVIIALLSI